MAVRNNKKKFHLQTYFLIMFVVMGLIMMLNWLIFKPFILNHESLPILRDLAYSIPNFCASVMLMFLFTFAILKVAEQRSEQSIPYVAVLFLALGCSIACILLAEYILTGSFRIDLLDISATISGLTITSLIFYSFGFSVERISPNQGV